METELTDSLARFVAALDYPTTTDQVKIRARVWQLDGGDQRTLEHLPHATFENAAELSEALSDSH